MPPKTWPKVCDVAVVGASTTGLYAAQLLAEGGLSVAVFERELRHQAAKRTLIVTPAFGEVLDSGIPEAVTIHRSRTMRVSACEVNADISFLRPDPIIERSAMVERLVDSALQAGVEICFGWRFAGLEGGTVLFEDPTGNILRVSPTKALVGADGVLSEVAGAAGIKCPPSVPIIQAEVELPSGWDPDVTKVWFRVEDTPYFYWLIPESSRRGVVGLIGAKNAPLRRQLDQFIALLGLEPLVYQGAQVAMHHPRLKPWGQSGSLPVLLVGDAAGQVKVTTVGGTVTGLIGAAAAARSVLRGTGYRHELRELKRELDVHWWMRKVLDRFNASDYTTLMKMLSGSVGAFLARYHRDQMARVVWRLPFLQPRLIGLGFRALCRRPWGISRRAAYEPQSSE